MTPSQKIKHMILQDAVESCDLELEPVTADNVDELYDRHNANGWLQDSRNEIRPGSIKTDIETPWNRNYDAASVASRYFDGTWVGWTYWYGGGKHGEPQAVPWIDEAYDLDVEEEEVLVTKYVWKRK